MRRISFAVVAAAVLIAGCHPGDCHGQGVDLKDVQNYGDGVEVLGVPGIQNYPDVQAVLENVPLDDSGKWHLTLFTQPGCTGCERLKQDLQQNRSLKIIADWCHFNVYSLDSQSQRFRFRRFKVASFPTLILYPPKLSPDYPFMTVDRMTGYNGDANGLAKRMIEKLKAFVAKFFRRRPLIYPNYPYPRPTPTPSPFRPDLSPLIPDLSPLIPDVPDLAPDDRSVGEYAEYPEVILIIDPEGLGERLKAVAAEKMIQRLREKYDLRLKIRTVKWEDAADQYPMVRRADTPAIVITRNKRLAGFLSIGVMTAMHGEELEGASGDWGMATTGTAASGWIVLAVIGGVVLLRSVARKRQQQGDSDEESALHRYRPSVMLGRAIEKVKASKAEAAASEKGAKRTAEDLSAEAKAEATDVDALRRSLD